MQGCMQTYWLLDEREDSKAEMPCLSKVQRIHVGVILLQRRGACFEQRCNRGDVAAAHRCYERCAAWAGMQHMPWVSMGTSVLIDPYHECMSASHAMHLLSRNMASCQHIRHACKTCQVLHGGAAGQGHTSCGSAHRRQSGIPPQHRLPAAAQECLHRPARLLRPGLCLARSRD